MYDLFFLCEPSTIVRVHSYIITRGIWLESHNHQMYAYLFELILV